MSARAFVDTNVLVYAVDRADPRKRVTARSILAGRRTETLVLSTQVLAEFYAVTTRKLAERLTEREGQERVTELATLPLVSTDGELIRAGIDVSRRSQLSVWDGLIVAAAAAGGCDILLTEDLNHGQSFGTVKVENPFRV